MHYLFLDTNIYLDMVIWRDDSVPPETLGYLLSVLRNSDVRLILPDIVVSEFHRNAKRVFEQCLKGLTAAYNELSKVNFPLIQELDAFRKFKEDMLQRLAKWKDMVTDDAYEYIVERFRQISSDPNVIKVTTTSAILEGVAYRRLFRRAPCHRDGKVCDADAALIEFLIRLPKIVSRETIDAVTFISRNIEDFTDGKNKTAFHPDILEDLHKAGLADKVTFSPYAYRTLKDKFRVEVAPDVVEREEKTVEAVSQSQLTRIRALEARLAILRWLESQRRLRRILSQADYERWTHPMRTMMRTIEPTQKLLEELARGIQSDLQDSPSPSESEDGLPEPKHKPGETSGETTDPEAKEDEPET